MGRQRLLGRHLALVAAPDYRGEAGVALLRSLQHSLAQALQQGDWDRVRQLDQVCMQVADRVIEANRQNQQGLVSILSELKDVYAGLIAQCQQEVCLLANQ